MKIKKGKATTVKSPKKLLPKIVKVKKEKISSNKKSKLKEQIKPTADLKKRKVTKEKPKKVLATQRKLSTGNVEPKIIKGSNNGISFTSIEKVGQCVKALYRITESHKEKTSNTLFKDKDFILLQINLLKVPEVEQPMRKYLKTHHSIYGEDPEICLIVADRPLKDNVKRTTDEEIDISVRYYEEFLKKQGVQGISAVLPWRQLAAEYATYELKRKLVNKFDLFAVQKDLHDLGKFSKLTGKSFNKKNKFPLPIKFPKDWDKPDPKFAERMQNLPKTTWFYLKPHSDTLIVRIGNISHTEEETVENLGFILSQIEKEGVIPGGLTNVSSILLKTTRSPPVPVYINLSSRNSVKEVPKVESKRPKIMAEEDELSTLPGKRVTVLPSGDVFVQDDPDASDLESDDEEPPKEKKRRKKSRKEEKNKEDEESDSSDEEIEAAEEAYLSKRFKK